MGPEHSYGVITIREASTGLISVKAIISCNAANLQKVVEELQRTKMPQVGPEAASDLYALLHKHGAGCARCRVVMYRTDAGIEAMYEGGGMLHPAYYEQFQDENFHPKAHTDATFFMRSLSRLNGQTGGRLLMK